MARIETWFPTAIYIEDNLFDSKQNSTWILKSEEIMQEYPTGGDEWQGDTYTTHSTEYNVLKDISFEPLINEVTKHVNHFAALHNSKRKFLCEGAWLNIARPGNFQEFHCHNGSTISAVYYIKTPLGSGDIVFEDPREPDMLPIPDIYDRNSLSFIKTGYPAIAGTLLIFRSYLRHMVMKGTNTESRISIALNF